MLPKAVLINKTDRCRCNSKIITVALYNLVRQVPTRALIISADIIGLFT